MEQVITRDMGLTPAEFFRTLPNVLDTTPFRVDGLTVYVEQPKQRLRIHLAPQPERRLGLLRLPNTQVRFVFENYAAADIDAFMERFARYYRRGGG